MGSYNNSFLVLDKLRREQPLLSSSVTVSQSSPVSLLPWLTACALLFTSSRLQEDNLRNDGFWKSSLVYKILLSVESRLDEIGMRV